MLFNKHKYMKQSSKKLLHKVGKKWMVLSIAVLGLLCGSVLMESSVNADSTSNQVNYTATNSQSNSVQSQANDLHAQLINNADQNQSNQQSAVRQLPAPKFYNTYMDSDGNEHVQYSDDGTVYSDVDHYNSDGTYSDASDYHDQTDMNSDGDGMGTGISSNYNSDNAVSDGDDSSFNEGNTSDQMNTYDRVPSDGYDQTGYYNGNNGYMSDSQPNTYDYNTYDQNTDDQNTYEQSPYNTYDQNTYNQNTEDQNTFDQDYDGINNFDQNTYNQNTYDQNTYDQSLDNTYDQNLYDQNTDDQDYEEENDPLL